MIVQDIINKVLALIDAYSSRGVIISAEKNADIIKKSILFADMAQKELWAYSKNTKQIELTHRQQPNRLGTLSNFNLVDFKGDTQYYPSEGGIANVNGYSFKVNEEASDNAVITFEELVSGVWTELVTVTPTSITELTVYKGVLTVTDTSNPVRMKISGTEHFLHKDRALWEYKYKVDSVPTYEAWVKEELPDDFNETENVIEEFPERQYNEMVNYKLENFRDFYFNFDFEGVIRITYKPIPSTITSVDDTIQIDEVLAQTIVYDIISKIGFTEDTALVNWAEGRRLEAKSESIKSEPANETSIINVYGGV